MKKKKTIKCVKFKGYDWVELTKPLNINVRQLNKTIGCNDHHYSCGGMFDEDILKEIIVHKIHYHMNRDNDETKEMTVHLRTFLTKLSEQDTPYKSVWEGLLNIKEDYNFLNMFKVLIGFMWS